MKDLADLAAWPVDLRDLFAVIGRLMAPGRLRPDIVEAGRAKWSRAIPGEHISIEHGVKGTVDAHHYIITIRGSRLDGRWRIRSGHFERLCRAAAKRSMAT